MSKKAEENVKEKIKGYLSENIDGILEDIDVLPPKERSAARLKLLDYVMPKQQAVKTSETIQKSKADFLLEQEAGLA